MGRLLMNIWSVLEIKPTEEVGAIKKAYAKKLKLHNPEEDPTGYQILREAYDRALKLAKNKKVNSYDKLFEFEKDIISKEKNYEEIKSKKLNKVNFTEDFTNEKRSYESIDNTNSTVDHTNEKMESFIEEFLDKVQNLYKDFHKRIDVENWKSILNTDNLWNLNYKNIISKRILNFLLYFPYVPKEVLQELNKTFHWSEEGNHLRDLYNDYSRSFLLDQLGKEIWLRYQYLSKKEGIDYDAFLEYRRLVFDALKNKDLKKADKYLSLANEIFCDDPDLMCMKAEVYLRRGELRRAKLLFRDAININNQDKKTPLYIANIYYNNCHYSSAINFCKGLIKLDSNNIELRLLLGKFYFRQKKFKEIKKAQNIFLDCLDFESYADEARKYLNWILHNYEASYEKEPWNLFIIKNLKKLYLILGESKKAGQVRFKLKKIFSLIITIVSHILVALILVIGIVFIYRIITIPNTQISVENVTAKKIELSWDKIRGAEMYNVYMHDNTSNKYKLIGVTKDTKFTESNLEPETVYTYKIASIKDGKEDIVSDFISVKTEAK
ncbi:tetratricopeptide repeat protein [Candidatus Clostridium radicumherbarum]|uniref:Fibronectin type-III domain-containing protein n=1 Tax=Candidatus Clostridium radicumherbarum TaxID=3381662 RepID=A0ABW8TR57_9CLOT